MWTEPPSGAASAGAVPPPSLRLPLPTAFQVFHSAPPHNGLEVHSHLESLQPGTVPVGSVLLVDCVAAHPEAQLVALVDGIRHRLPQAPVIVRLERSLPQSRIYSELRVRAVCSRRDAVRSIARQQLTSRSGLGENMIEWLTLRGLEFTPAAAFTVREIFDRAPEFHVVHDLFKVLGVSASVIDPHLREQGFPVSGLWLNVARALHASLYLQANTDQALPKLVGDLGYTEVASLNVFLLRSFQLRAREIQPMLGWEWLMDRWLTSLQRTTFWRRAA